MGDSGDLAGALGACLVLLWKSGVSVPLKFQV